MLIGHLSIPLIIYGLSLNLGIFHTKASFFALMVGSTIPNLDAWFTISREKTPSNPMDEVHAGTIMHTPFLYIILFFPLWYFLNLSIAFMFSLGGLTHIISECFDQKGRKLLYPFNNKYYGTDLFPYDFWTYVTDLKMIAYEGTLLLIACILILI